MLTRAARSRREIRVTKSARAQRIAQPFLHNSSVRIITTAPRRHTRGSEEWSSASHAGSHADSRSPEQGWFGYCPQNHDCQSIANLAQDVFLWFILVNFGSSHISAGFQTAGPEPSTIQQYR